MAHSSFNTKRARCASRTKQNTRNSTLEQVRVIQLSVCLVLFLTVFLGKGIFPERMTQVQQNIQYLLSSSMDLRHSMEMLGLSFSEENEPLSELGSFCLEVFGFDAMLEPEPSQSYNSVEATDILTTEINRLSTQSSAEEVAEHYMEPAYAQLTLNREKTEFKIEPEESIASVPVAGTVLMEANYSGRPLPKNYTMDQLSLGALETTTPVLGHLNSEYGYRDHPINGVYQFHGGVDIGGQKGDPIAAFADGTVEYIGEDNSYGLYLQIDHGNGVKSFYAHCNKLFVSKGDLVSAGETIAAVGSSGAATGPHLHLELKYNNLRVNPAYYLEFLTV